MVGPKDFNVFTSFFSNWIFLAISVLIFAVQYLASSEIGGFTLTWLFVTEKIKTQDFYTCVIWGSTVLIVSFLLKMTPGEWMEKVPIRIDENKVLGGESKIVALYERSMNV